MILLEAEAWIEGHIWYAARTLFRDVFGVLIFFHKGESPSLCIDQDFDVQRCYHLSSHDTMTGPSPCS
jgi:hypothetical protein